MKVNEIFFSIQGESTYAGLPCAFVRLTGCNLRCSYCDTTHAYDEGEEQTVDQVLDTVARFPTGLVEITGGEPLLQPETPSLVAALADRGYEVLIETNGTVSLDGIDGRARTIMDIKCPGSGMSGHVLWGNLNLLRSHDEIKFVLTDRIDYEWAFDIVEKYRLHEKHVVHLSPAFGVLEPHQLASWMLASPRPEGRLNMRLQLQIHKYIWPRVERGV
ncbi:MAG: radical SAM protein [Candidatus Hydrogenedentota bacterium]|nr:MAG: radical SAM protein [Candidatus Hydrogenedentota bacterium]